MKVGMLITATMLLLSLYGCATTSGPSSPALSGNTQYPGALPSPANTQETSAISASTMRPAAR